MLINVWNPSRLSVIRRLAYMLILALMGPGIFLLPATATGQGTKSQRGEDHTIGAAPLEHLLEIEVKHEWGDGLGDFSSALPKPNLTSEPNARQGGIGKPVGHPISLAPEPPMSDSGLESDRAFGSSRLRTDQIQTGAAAMVNPDFLSTPERERAD